MHVIKYLKRFFFFLFPCAQHERLSTELTLPKSQTGSAISEGLDADDKENTYVRRKKNGIVDFCTFAARKQQAEQRENQSFSNINKTLSALCFGTDSGMCFAQKK